MHVMCKCEKRGMRKRERERERDVLRCNLFYYFITTKQNLL